MEFKEEESSERTCSKKAIIVLIIFVFFIVVSLVAIVVLVKKTRNDLGEYYLSEKICETESNGNKVCYKKINVNAEHYIKELSEDVKRSHVRYDNRYGITLAADLYTPKNLDKKKKYRGLVIGPPYGGVKEQGPSVYANYFAKEEFIVVAFDPSFNGESGGKNRKISSSDIFMEDFSASVDYLGTLEYVDRENIGAIGICGSAGFLLGAAAIDKRIKTVITVVMYDIPYTYYTANETKWQEKIEILKSKRWNDVDKGTQQYDVYYRPDRVYVDDTIPSEFPKYDYWKKFYSTERGHHARSTGGFTFISESSLANLQVTNNIKRIAPRNILFVYCEDHNTSSYEFTTSAITETNSSNYIKVENALHLDLYDNVDKIPFKGMNEFLNNNLEKKIKN